MLTKNSNRVVPNQKELRDILHRWSVNPVAPSWSPSSKRRKELQLAYEAALADRDAALEKLRSLWWAKEMIVWTLRSKDAKKAELLWAEELSGRFGQSWWRTACRPCGRLLQPQKTLRIEIGLVEQLISFPHFACPSCGRWDKTETFATRIEWIGEANPNWEVAIGDDVIVVNSNANLAGAKQPTWYLDPVADDGVVNTLLESLASHDNRRPTVGRCIVAPHAPENCRRLLQHGGFVLEEQTSALNYRPLDPSLDRPSRAVIITTFAGTGEEGSSGDGGPALSAELSYPAALAIAPDGSLYIAEGNGRRVRRVGPDGIITTFAGTGVQGSSGDGGPALSAELSYPAALAVAPDGSLYIAERAGHRVRRVGPDGIIMTFAGTGVQGSSGDGGPALSAELSYPAALAVAPDGSLYIAGWAGHRVRRVGPDGIIMTFAGTGVQGSSGDGGPALSAELSYPAALAVAPDGSLYIADSNGNRVRRVGPDGIITTIAGTRRQGFSGDGGPATETQLFLPCGLAIAPDGSLYIAESSEHRVRWVGPDGIITTFAETGPDGIIMTGREGFSGVGRPATWAQLHYRRLALALSPDGSLYIADGDGNSVRRVGCKNVSETDHQVSR